MNTGAEAQTWVGQPLPRLEDESLLRGKGRYLDDLDPVPNACHAAILRSQLAHARITRLDASAALELPGVVGALTGSDVASTSHPFPAGVDSPIPTEPPPTRSRGTSASRSASSLPETATSPRTHSS